MVIPFGTATGVQARFLEDKLRVGDVVHRLVSRGPCESTFVLFYEFLQRPVFDILAVLEAHEIATLIGEELDVIEQLHVELLAKFREGTPSVSIVKDDLLVLRAVLELVPFLGVEVVPIVPELREATSDKVWLLKHCLERCFKVRQRFPHLILGVLLRLLLPIIVVFLEEFHPALALEWQSSLLLAPLSPF